MDAASLGIVLQIVTVLVSAIAAVGVVMVNLQGQQNAFELAKTQAAVKSAQTDAKETKAITAETKETVQIIKVDINHRMDQLLAVATASSEAKGRDSMRAADDPSLSQASTAATSAASAALARPTDALPMPTEPAAPTDQAVTVKHLQPSAVDQIVAARAVAIVDAVVQALPDALPTPEKGA